MHIKTLFLMLCIICTIMLVLADIAEEDKPDSWFSIKNIETRADLHLPAEREHYINTTNTNTIASTTIRTPIEVCQHKGLGKCYRVDDQFDFSWGLARIIWQQSRFKDCSKFTSTLNNGKFKYTYYATGHNCRTTAKDETIAGAINKYLNTVANHEICGTVCLNLDHAGTWSGWVKVGEAKHFNEQAYCGVQLDFNNCSEGGNNDLP
ncbi:hypothetical protein BJY04DRAFT_213734 [Aspergillus karnatakaensis]|uniref:uncharacterized protein n=1 Tax=Aspergillus karnatakaensis TaxID=1810916 RepID=UPI003CCD9076